MLWTEVKQHVSDDFFLFVAFFLCRSLFWVSLCAPMKRRTLKFILKDTPPSPKSLDLTKLQDDPNAL